MLLTSYAIEFADSLVATFVALEMSLDPKQSDPQNEARARALAYTNYDMTFPVTNSYFIFWPAGNIRASVVILIYMTTMSKRFFDLM